MISALALTLALSTTAVPPGGTVENHAHPAHYAQPEVRRYERFTTDYGRRLSWNEYTHEIENLWKVYRETGSTPAGFAIYKRAAAAAKQKFVYADPYYVAIEP